MNELQLFTADEVAHFRQTASTRNIMQLQEDNTLSSDISSDKEFIYLFLENKRQSSENTARNYAKEIAAFLRFIGFPDIPLSKVTFKMCSAYRNFLNDSKKNYADSTKTNKLNIVSSLYRFGIKIGYLKQNPISAVIRPKVTVTTQDRYLTKEETNKLLIELKDNPRNYLIGILTITTGLRASELVGIEWKNFYEDTKGNIGLKIIGKRNQERTVKIRRDVWSYIVQYRISQERNPDFDSTDESYLFLNKFGEPLSDRYLRKMLKEKANKAGIKKSISTHWLRHTSASLAITGGADIKTVMESFGWNNMQTAQRYIHNINKLEKTAVDFIDIEI